MVLDSKSKQDEAINTLQHRLSEKEVQLQYMSQDREELKSQLKSSMETITTLKNEIQKQYQTLTYQDEHNKKMFEEKYQDMVQELNTKESLIIKLQENLNKMKDVAENTRNSAIRDTETVSSYYKLFMSSIEMKFQN
jgi:Ni,Fe-hydrogenase I large subunit